MRKILILLLLVLSVSLSFAQESTEVPVAPTEEATLPTADVTEEASPVATELPIVEPTLEVPTEAPTSEEPTSEVPTVEPTIEATAYAPAPEPALSLWASDNFEGAVSSQWILPAGWLGNGTGLSIESANSAFFSGESFSEVAVQTQFQLSEGSTVSVFVRTGYRASLNSDGHLSLWRDDTELASSMIALNPDGHFLRLSAFGDTLRLGLDGQTLLVAQDATYTSGQIGVRVDFAEAGVITLDNFGVWIPTSMMPTPVPGTPASQNSMGSVQVLLAPNLTAPALNGIITKIRPTFTWQARTSAVQYHLRIATNFSCSTPIASGDIFQTGTSFTPTFDIVQGEYWYCVEAQDAALAWSGFGEKRHFVVNYALTPANAARNTTNFVTNFTWTAIAGASYDLQIATDSSFSVTVDINDLTTNSYSYINPAYGQYYWRVTVNDTNVLPMALAYSYYITPPLPVAVNNAPPLNNGKYTNNVNPTLNWTVPANWQILPAGQSITYELQLATDQYFTSMVSAPVTGIGTPTHTWTATSLADGRYYWRVRAITNLGLAGAWSATFNFNVDTAAQAEPALSAPANSAIVKTARPAFSWRTVAGANRYLLEVSMVPDFSTTVISVTQSTTSYTATSSLAQSAYFWRVRSIDAAGNYSAIPGTVRSFTVDYRVSPTPEQTFVSASPRTMSFRWNLVPGATGAIYTVEIDDDINFGSVDYSSNAISTGSWTSPTLPQGRYYWRLAVTGYNSTGASAFIISPALPNAPALSSPANNANTNDTSPLLQWSLPTQNNGSVTGYELQISTNSTFTALVGGTIAVGTTSYTIAPDLPASVGTTYYWRVRAVTNLGARGAWSTARTFRLDTTVPGMPTQVSPINGADVTTTTPQLKWNAVTGANRYEVRYGLSSDLSAVTPILVTTAYYTVPSPLLLDTYYWEVRALDAAGNTGAWSGVEDFDVVSPPTAVSSIWNFTTATPTLTWTPLYWAGSYEIQVSTSSSFTTTAFTTTVGALTNSVTTTTLPEGFYYWRVRGLSQAEAGGGAGAWSATETFTIDLP